MTESTQNPRNSLDDLAIQTRERYSARYASLGRHIRTLGWGSEAQQQIRFTHTLLPGEDYTQLSILDIGCGFGDYLTFLKSQGLSPAAYTGWDLNPDLLREAKALHPNSPNITFAEENLLSRTSASPPVADVGVMLGLLNFNWKERYDNATYTREALQKAFSLVRKTLIVDFLSNRITPSYPREDFVYYHDPVEMLSYALELTNRVVLKQDYPPIPQREFMLILHHE